MDGLRKRIENESNILGEKKIILENKTKELETYISNFLLYILVL